MVSLTTRDLGDPWVRSLCTKDYRLNYHLPTDQTGDSRGGIHPGMEGRGVNEGNQ